MFVPISDESDRVPLAARQPVDLHNSHARHRVSGDGRKRTAQRWADGRANLPYVCLARRRVSSAGPAGRASYSPQARANAAKLRS